MNSTSTITSTTITRHKHRWTGACVTTYPRLRFCTSCGADRIGSRIVPSEERTFLVTTPDGTYTVKEYSITGAIEWTRQNLTPDWYGYAVPVWVHDASTFLSGIITAPQKIHEDHCSHGDQVYCSSAVKRIGSYCICKWTYWCKICNRYTIWTRIHRGKTIGAIYYHSAVDRETLEAYWRLFDSHVNKGIIY